ncbi:MAG: hypothetical protein Q9165_007393 [Trypethelium subeluteriae]
MATLRSGLGTIALLPILAFIAVQFHSPGLIEELIRQWVSTGSSESAAADLRSSTPIIMAALTAFGHMEKVSTIADGLIKRGYPVTLVSGSVFKDSIEKIGAVFEPVDGPAALVSEEDMAHSMSLPEGEEKEQFLINAIWIDGLSYFESTMQRVFAEHKKSYGNTKPIIYIGDYSFPGLAPQVFGAPGVKPDAYLSIGLSALMVESNDSFPFRDPRMPDRTTQSREIHWRAQQAQYREPLTVALNTAWESQLRTMGATAASIPAMFESFYHLSDLHLQLNIPAFEFPRTDLTLPVHFIGPLPTVGIGPRDLPPWWPDLLAAKAAGKRIIAVSSGSQDNNPDDLILPTLRACAAMPDVFVVATLVATDPTTSGGGGGGAADLEERVLRNARLAKYVPYDLLLPQASLMVSSGGWGAVQHGLRAGVPMVVSGVAQDKATVCALVEWAGIGVNLRARRPGEERLREAVREVLGNASYREKVAELAAEARRYDPIGEVDRIIQEAVQNGGRVRKGARRVGGPAL